MTIEITRRTALAVTLAAAAPLMSKSAKGYSPSSSEAATGPVRVGDFTVTQLRDGTFPIPAKVFPELDSDEGRALLEKGGLPPAGPVPSPVNAWLVRRGDKTWLLDAGCGTVFGPGFDRVEAALAAEGVKPASLETIWVSHLHGDHVGGLTSRDGSARFPNAELVLQEKEVAYWTDAGERSRAAEGDRKGFDIATRALDAYKGRLRTITGEASLASGATSIPLPGHTPGHAGVLLEDGSERLLIWADVVHSRLVQFSHPAWTLAFDVDTHQAVATRKRILDRAVTEKLPIAGMHLADVGRIERSGAAYELLPM